MQFLPNAPYNAANTPTRDTHKLWDQRRVCSPNKTMWLVAFAGELGDVVSRPLPHGILDTPEDTQVGGFPQKSGLVCVCLNFSLFLKVCRGSLGGPVSPGAYQLNPPKMYINMKGNYFLNPRHYFSNLGNYFLNLGNYFLNPGNYLLNPRNYFLNPRNYFLNPRNYFLTGHKPRNQLQSQDCFYQSQPLDKDSSKSLEVQRLPQTSEPCSHPRERGCQAVDAGILHSVSFYVLWLLISESVTVSFLLFNL